MDNDKYIIGIKIKDGTNTYTYPSTPSAGEEKEIFNMITYKTNTPIYELENTSSIDKTYVVSFYISSTIANENISGLIFNEGNNVCEGKIGNITTKTSIPEDRRPKSIIDCGSNDGTDPNNLNMSLDGFYTSNNATLLYPVGGFVRLETSEEINKWGNTNATYRVFTPLGKIKYGERIYNADLFFVMGNGNVANNLTYLSDARYGDKTYIDIFGSYGLFGKSVSNTTKMKELCEDSLNNDACVKFCNENGVNCDDIATTYCSTHENEPVCGCFSKTDVEYKNEFSNFLNRVNPTENISTEKCYTKACNTSSIFPYSSRMTCSAMKKCTKIYDGETINYAGSCNTGIENEGGTYIKYYVAPTFSDWGNCSYNTTNNRWEQIRTKTLGNLINDPSATLPTSQTCNPDFTSCINSGGSCILSNGDCSGEKRTGLCGDNNWVCCITEDKCKEKGGSCYTDKPSDYVAIDGVICPYDKICAKSPEEGGGGKSGGGEFSLFSGGGIAVLVVIIIVVIGAIIGLVVWYRHSHKGEKQKEKEPEFTDISQVSKNDGEQYLPSEIEGKKRNVDEICEQWDKTSNIIKTDPRFNRYTDNIPNEISDEDMQYWEFLNLPDEGKMDLCEKMKKRKKYCSPETKNECDKLLRMRPKITSIEERRKSRGREKEEKEKNCSKLRDELKNFEDYKILNKIIGTRQDYTKFSIDRNKLLNLRKETEENDCKDIFDRQNDLTHIEGQIAEWEKCKTENDLIVKMYEGIGTDPSSHPIEKLHTNDGEKTYTYWRNKLIVEPKLCKKMENKGCSGEQLDECKHQPPSEELFNIAVGLCNYTNDRISDAEGVPESKDMVEQLKKDQATFGCEEKLKTTKILTSAMEAMKRQKQQVEEIGKQQIRIQSVPQIPDIEAKSDIVPRPMGTEIIETSISEGLEQQAEEEATKEFAKIKKSIATENMPPTTPPPVIPITTASGATSPPVFERTLTPPPVIPITQLESKDCEDKLTECVENEKMGLACFSDDEERKKYISGCATQAEKFEKY